MSPKTILIGCLVLASCGFGARADQPQDTPPTPPAVTPEVKPTDPVYFPLQSMSPRVEKRSIKGPTRVRKVFLDEYPRSGADAWKRAIQTAAGEMIDPLYGEMYLGDRTDGPYRFVLTRTASERAHREQLILDTNRDGRIDPKREVFKTAAKPRTAETPDELLIEFMVPITIKYEDGTLTHDYRLWLNDPPRAEDQRVTTESTPTVQEEPDVRPGIWYERVSWMEGTVKIRDTTYRLAMFDFTHDGRWTRFDRWYMVPDDGEAGTARQHVLDSTKVVRMRQMLKLDGDFYQLVDVTKSGKYAAVRYVGPVEQPAPETTPAP